ncbi:putative sulfate exporter family transporter, partial [Escherichia coli]
MTNITLQKQHRTLWHFIPGLALSAVITGVALWGGSIPAVAGAGFSALTLAILLGMVLGNTIYPHIWKIATVPKITTVATATVTLLASAFTT